MHFAYILGVATEAAAAPIPITMKSKTYRIILINAHIKAALAQFALLIGVLLPKAHTNKRIIFTSGMHSKKLVSNQLPTVTGLYVVSSIFTPFIFSTLWMSFAAERSAGNFLWEIVPPVQFTCP
jgi:hypothetical protein